MATVVESGLRFRLPPGASFRFQELPTYRRLSGRALKEMDVAWCDGDALIVVEVKDYREQGPRLLKEAEGWSAWLIGELDRKVADSLLMLLAAWSGVSGHGQALRSELPECARRAPRHARFVIALRLPPSARPLLGALRDRLRAKLAGRLALCGAAPLLVLDYESLARRFPGLVELEP